MNKRYIILSVIVLSIILLISGIILFNNIRKNKEEDKLYNQLNSVVKDYYKDYYYNTLGDNEDIRKSNAEKLKHVGIKITLYDLSNYKSNNEDILSLFKNAQTKADCDYNKTTITIYPIEPYGREDIKIDSNLVCGI